MAASPILTRLYTPAEFGVMGAYAAALYLIASVASLRLETAIPLAPTADDAQSLAAMALICVVLTAGITAVGTFVFRSMLPPGTTILFAWALPLGVLALGFYNVAMNWRLRTHDHALIAKTRVLQAISAALVQLGFGWAGVGSIGLVCGQIVGVSGGLTRLTNISFIRLVKALTKDDAGRQFRNFGHFIKFNTPAALLSIGNTHAPTMVIAVVASPAAAGLYAVVQRVLVTPFGMVSNALASSIFSHARALGDDDTSSYSAKFLSLSAIFSPILVGGALTVNYGFRSVFGQDWEEGGHVAAWVTMFLGQKFIFDSVFSIFTTTGRAAVGLLLQASIFSIRLIALIVASAYLSFSTSIEIFAFISAASYFLASQASLNTPVGRRLGDFTVGVFDCFLPFAMVFCVLTNQQIVAVGAAYCAWVVWRLWSMWVSAVRARKIAR